MGGGWCYVKELIMAEYAPHFLDAGVAALIFDYRNFGASEGEPRQHIGSWRQIADYHTAVDAVSYLDEFKAVAVWGISYSGGHVLAVTALDWRVKCCVSQICHRGSVQLDASARFGSASASWRPRPRGTETAVPLRRAWNHSALRGPKGGRDLAAPGDQAGLYEDQGGVGPRHEHYSSIPSVEFVWAYNMRPYLPMILDTPRS